jgi:AraC-type DNA-binding domain-containing proteins
MTTLTQRTSGNFTFASGSDGCFSLPPASGLRVCVSFAADSMAVQIRRPNRRTEQAILPPGAALVADRRATAEVTWIGPAEVLAVSLDESVLNATSRNLGVPNLPRSGAERITDPAIRNITGMVRDLMARDQELPESVATSATQLLAVRLLSHGERQSSETRKERLSPSALRRTLTFIDDHLVENFTLEDMAAAAGCSRFHFARAFRSSTGVSPWRYVTARRLKQAETLLRTREGLSVAEVCHMVGFQDQSHFTRAFKNVFSVTPGSVRRRSLGRAA